MKIAVVGAGISGLACAWLLSRMHEVTLYEANDYLGGHTHTHSIELEGRSWQVDTGFIVHNAPNYPLFSRLLAELGVATQPTTMGFALRDERDGLEYNAGTSGGLFVQKRRLFSPRHWRMIADILRFYREAPALLATPGPGPSLAEYLQQQRYCDGFVEQHIVPMACALWSTPAAAVRAMPAQFLVAFMANHHMLQASDRPPWRVVCGGSQTYVRALTASWRATARTSTPVRALRREPTGGIELRTDDGSERYDHAILACHADDALALLTEAGAREREILGAIGYQANDTVLHTDARLLPRDRRAWAAWNALIVPGEEDACTVSYCMNLLQSLDAPEPLVVTLNRTHAIDPARILRRMRYRHPVYSQAAVAAQARRNEIDGVDRVSFAGAYWGWGFHEDGMRSAVEVARALGSNWP